MLVVDNGEDGSFGNDIVEKDAGRVWCPNPFTESDAQLVHLHHIPYLHLFTVSPSLSCPGSLQATIREARRIDDGDPSSR